MVKGFGEFVAGGQIVVGLIIFTIIVLIQFIVITRVRRVLVKLPLDSRWTWMPGRQMAIDADLNAGMIDEREAKRRRDEITSQADFFGAMDGASKFVRGDAIAGIMITVINVVGGLIIGVVQYGMSVGDAASVFTQLTIGDGLVSQVPAFLISLAAGLLVTRSTNSTNLPSEFLKQLFSRPQALAVAGAFLGVLVFTNLPTIPLLMIGASCVGIASFISKERVADEQKKVEAQKAEKTKQPEERIEDYLATDPMEFEIGVGLIKLADPKRGGDLLERIQAVRQNVAADLGIILPKIRIRDNFQLEQNQYRIKIAGMPVAMDVVYPDGFLAIDSGMTTGRYPVPRPKTRLRDAGDLDRPQPPRSRRDERLHRRRTGQRFGDALDCRGSRICRRDSDA